MILDSAIAVGSANSIQGADVDTLSIDTRLLGSTMSVFGALQLKAFTAGFGVSFSLRRARTLGAVIAD